MACDCHWCNRCGLPVMDGPFISGYCQLERNHDGPHTLNKENADA